MGRIEPSPLPPRDEWRPALSAEIGARFHLPSLFSLEVGARTTWVEDQPYEEALGEEIRYSMLTLRFLARVR